MNAEHGFGAELKALETVLHALHPLDSGQRHFVVSAAIQRFSIFGDATPLPKAATQTGMAAGATGGSSDETPKAFLKRKHPVTDVQRIACLAYYLTHHRGVLAFKTRALTQLNIDAAGDPFANAAFTAKNAATQSRFFSSAGKGQKQITALGEDVVDALPDQEKVKAAIEAAGAGRRKRRARNAGAEGK